MPLLAIFRLLGALLSLLILGTAGYLLWSWLQGEWIAGGDGVLYRDRDDWRLWTGLGFLAWSFLGRIIAPRLLARPDERPTKSERSNGQTIPGASGSTLYVESHGPSAAPPIIFTHGWSLDSTVWHYAKHDLGDRFQLVLWDLPGLGRSKAPGDGHISLNDFAADLGAVLSLSGPRPAVLVGHSIGGMTIQTLIRDHPELSHRIAGVVLVNTTYTNPLKTMILSGLMRALQKPVIEPLMHLTVWLQPLVWLSKWQSYLSGSTHLAHRFGFGKFVTRSQLEQSARLATKSPPSVVAKGDLAMLRWDASGALAGFDKPVLVIGGDKDIITKLEASRVIAGETPAASLQVVEDVNHLGFLERADIYNQLIRNFALAVQPSVTLDQQPPVTFTVDRDAPAGDEDGRRPDGAGDGASHPLPPH